MRIHTHTHVMYKNIYDNILKWIFSCMVALVVENIIIIFKICTLLTMVRHSLPYPRLRKVSVLYLLVAPLQPSGPLYQPPTYFVVGH